MTEQFDGWCVRGDGLWGVAEGKLVNLSHPPKGYPPVPRPARDVLLARLRYAVEQLEGQDGADAPA